jgi:hypothetical protein
MNPDPRLGKFPFGVWDPFRNRIKKEKKKLAKIARIDNAKQKIHEV